jgi:hypothetical protein
VGWGQFGFEIYIKNMHLLHRREGTVRMMAEIIPQPTGATFMATNTE